MGKTVIRFVSEPIRAFRVKENTGTPPHNPALRPPHFGRSASWGTIETSQRPVIMANRGAPSIPQALSMDEHGQIIDQGHQAVADIPQPRDGATVVDTPFLTNESTLDNQSETQGYTAWCYRKMRVAALFGNIRGGFGPIEINVFAYASLEDVDW